MEYGEKDKRSPNVEDRTKDNPNPSIIDTWSKWRSLMKGWTPPEKPEEKPDLLPGPRDAPMKLGGPPVDLGSLIPGEGPMQAGASGDGTGRASPPSGGGTWQSLVNDPISRSAMMSFGLQLMVGGYGNGLSQFGQALGAGAEGAGNTAKALQAQQINDRDFQAKQEEGSANRASHEKVAQIGASSREEVAHVKTAGMLERAALIHGPQNNQEMNIYSKARTDYMKKEKDNQLISRKSDQQIVQEADAWAKEQLRGAREAVGVRSQGSALPAESQAPGSPSSAAPGSPTQAGASPQSALKPSWDQIKSNPQVQELLKSAAGRKRLKVERPDLSGEIDQFATPYEN